MTIRTLIGGGWRFRRHRCWFENLPGYYNIDMLCAGFDGGFRPVRRAK